MTVQEAHNFLFDPLPFCGCGDPLIILEKIQACLEYAESQQTQKEPWNEMVEQLFAGDSASAYLVFFMLDDVELIDHGENLHEAWLTDTGAGIPVCPAYQRRGCRCRGNEESLRPRGIVFQANGVSSLEQATRI